jgi:hypothetical protein
MREDPMNHSNRHMRWMAGPLAAAILLAATAPAAQADHWRRYKGEPPRIAPYHASGSVYIVRHSSAGPAIAGFLGGLFLGATLAHAAPAGYAYYDPYCDEDFVSLEVYRAHLRHHHHARIVRVIERDNGECVHSYNYYNGGWHDWDGDWDGDRDDD